MRRIASVFAITLAAIGLIALSALSETAEAHGNCVQRDAGDWTLTGCVSADGEITWTAVDIFGTLYLWSDGQWQVQERPPLPDIDLLPETRTVARAKYGLPTLGRQGDGRIFFQHAPSTEDLSTLVTVQGTSNSPHFPFARLSLSCRGGLPLSVTVSAFARYGTTEYQAQLNSPEDAQASFEDAPPYRWTDFKFKFRYYGAQISPIEYVSSPLGHEYPKDADSQFFRELIKQDHLTMRLPEVDGPILVHFDLDGVFDTPVQHLLERCLDES